MRKLMIGAAFATVLAAAACAQTTAERSETIVLSGTIESIDAETREVVIAGPEGGSFVVTAGPEMRNFDQVEAGDRVTLEYSEGVALAMAEPGDDGAPEALIGAARAAEGERPGAAVGEIISFVVELVSYDAEAHTATVIFPDGTEDTVPVHEEMRSFAAARAPGDRVLVAIGSAVAVTVTPEG